jgi:hypothetical protein
MGGGDATGGGGGILLVGFVQRYPASPVAGQPMSKRLVPLAKTTLYLHTQ